MALINLHIWGYSDNPVMINTGHTSINTIWEVKKTNYIEDDKIINYVQY